MRINKFAKALVTCALASACALGVFAITGCSSDDGKLTADSGLTGGVAASVNGEEISEDKITKLINNYRLNYDYEEDDAWKDYLKQSNSTPEALRYTLLSGYVNQLIVSQCAEKLGVSVTDEEVTEKVDKVKSQYSSDEAWEDALKQAGFEEGEQEYWDTVKNSMLQEKINEIYTEEAEKELRDNKKVLSEVNEAISSYDGAKKASLVLFSSDDEELAKSVRTKIKNGEMTIAEAAKEYSTDTATKDSGGDLGWDVLAQLDENYTSILSDLEKDGALSKATSTENGWAIIQLDEVYKAPKKVTKLSSVPEDFVTTIKATATESNASDKYGDWLDSMKTEQDVVVNPMPENVSYNVDMSGEYTEEEIKEIDDEAYEQLVGKAAAAEAQEAAAEDAAAEESSSSDASEAAEGDSGSDEGASEADDQADGSAEGETEEAAADAESTENDEADSGE